MAIAERADGLLTGLTLSQVTVEATAGGIMEQAKSVAITMPVTAGCRRG